MWFFVAGRVVGAERSNDDERKMIKTNSLIQFANLAMEESMLAKPARGSL
jgi:hypothetical protein